MNKFSRLTPEIQELAVMCEQNIIDKDLYTKYNVNRGLRDLNGKGVLTGLTEISEIVSKKMVDGEEVSCDGELYYRGIDVHKITDGITSAGRHNGFEEVTYLLLFGKLPNEDELLDFMVILANYRDSLPKNFVRDVIMKAPSSDIMNNLQRAVLTLYSYDNNANDISIPNVLRQSLELIAMFPMLAVYSYAAKIYYKDNKSLYIHRPRANLSTAENILYMLRPDNKFTPLEAQILDLSLVLHAEHGGGNNSTFTTHVVSSAGSDTYSVIAAALSSLKGPKHGGANLKVVQMMNDLKKNVSDISDREQVRAYLEAILDGRAFDGKGLIYGMGHAVYSISDPREQVFKSFVTRLAEEKGRCDELMLYNNIEKIAPEVIAAERKIYKGVSPNVDFYSGFVYSMLGIPVELYTPLFAIARIVGWSAHRIEELVGNGKIIRPAYLSIMKERKLD